MRYIYKKSAETEKRKADKRQIIYKLSAELFLEKGYFNTSVRDISSKLNISTGSFYNYFSSKEDLFAEIYDNFAKRIFSTHNNATALFVNNPLVYIIRSISITLLMYQKYKEEALMLRVLEVGCSNLFRDKITQLTSQSYLNMEKLFFRFRDNNNLEITNIEMTAICYVNSINGFIISMLINKQDQNAFDLTLPLISYTLNALGIDYDLNIVKDIFGELEYEFNSGSFA